MTSNSGSRSTTGSSTTERHRPTHACQWRAVLVSLGFGALALTPATPTSAAKSSFLTPSPHRFQGALMAAPSAAGAVSAATGPSTPVKHCKRGTTAAVIAGKHVCLAAGQTCRKAADKQYHRYRFHCHSGKLTRFKPNPSPPLPPLPQPPQLPGVKVDVGGYKLYIHCIGSGDPTVVFEGGTGTADATRPAPKPRTSARHSRAAPAFVPTTERGSERATEDPPARRRRASATRTSFMPCSQARTSRGRTCSSGPRTAAT